MLDITAQHHGAASLRSTAPGSVRASLGGVGRNMAEAAQRMLDTVPLAAHAYAHASDTAADAAIAMPPGAVRFVGPMARDAMSVLLKTLWQVETPMLRLDGLLDLSQHSAEGTPTASLTLFASGDLEQGVIQASLVERLTAEHVDAALASHLDAAPASHEHSTQPVVVLDSNLAVPALRRALEHTRRSGGLALLEPTSVTKSVRIVEAALSCPGQGNLDSTMVRTALAHGSRPEPQSVSCIMTPNLLELRAMMSHARKLAPEAYGLALNAVKTIQVDDSLRSLLIDSGSKSEDMSPIHAADCGDAVGEEVQELANLLAFTDTIGPVALTLGPQGVLLVLPPTVVAQLPQRTLESATRGTTWRLSSFASASKIQEWELIHVPPPFRNRAGKGGGGGKDGGVASTTGAGDTFAGALAALLAVSCRLVPAAAPDASVSTVPAPWSHLRSPRSVLSLAQAAAMETLRSHRAVGKVHRLASVSELAGVWLDFFASDRR